MKFINSTLFTTLALAALTTAAPSLDTVYQLRLSSKNPAINDTLVTVKDGSLANASPNAMGSFSTGEPRSPYTFKFVSSSLSSILYELQATVRQTHLVLTGNQVALGLYDVPIGADPKPSGNELTASDKWWVWEQDGKTQLMVAERYDGDDSKLMSAGSWRACKGDSEVDYTLYWFDGLNRLEDYVKGCEGGISLTIEEAQASATTGDFLTGVPAPTSFPSGHISDVPANNFTAAVGVKPTGSPSSFEDSSPRTAIIEWGGIVAAIVAFLL